MKERMKLIAGVALLIQSVTMFVLFLSQLKKRRGLAAAFLSVSAACGLLGGKLVVETDEDEYEIPDIDLGDEDVEEITETEETADDGELSIDDDLLKADLEHGTDDEAQSK